MYCISRIFNPEIYQGKYRRKNYFEGWYFKIIDRHSKNIFAIIPGVSIAGKQKHAFIQFIDAVTGKTCFLKYKIEDFLYAETDFDIAVADNHFNAKGFCVDFNSEEISVQGKINYSNIVPFPKSRLNPGIMGPFSFVPFMECYHGIVNIHCELEGGLDINGKFVDFTGGYGYIEKDWGTSFPESWIWLQSNHFNNENISFMFSIAVIPWLNTHFNGMISFLRINDQMFRFATYTGAKVKALQYDREILSILIEDSKYILAIKAENTKGGRLKAPKKGNMELEIIESITASVEVDLREKSGRTIFSGVGKNTGLEFAGDFKKFII